MLSERLHRKYEKITEGKTIKEPELITFFVNLTRLCHYLCSAVLGKCIQTATPALDFSTEHDVRKMEEENTIEYFQTTLELLKDKGEVKFMLTSTFVLYDFFFLP